MLRSQALLSCHPEGCQEQKLERCLADSYSPDKPRYQRSRAHQQFLSESPERRSVDTTTVRQVVTTHLPLGTRKSPLILKLRSGRYEIVNLLTTHLRRCGPEDPHRSSLSRVQRVSLVLCLFWEQHKSAREKQQSLDRSNSFQVVARYALHCRSISTVTRKVCPCVVTNTLTLYIYGFFQIITSRTRKASKKNYVHITQ
jgi:hypothetical protein